MRRHRAYLAAAVLVWLAPVAAPAQSAKSYALESAAGLRLHNVTAEASTLAGQKGLRLTLGPGADAGGEQLAVIEGLEFSSGVIEVEVAGEPGPGAAQGARGFVGVAFRLQPDTQTYDAFYLRPTNGRAEEQERRNHAAQYISHPAWT